MCNLTSLNAFMNEKPRDLICHIDRESFSLLEYMFPGVIAYCELDLANLWSTLSDLLNLPHKKTENKQTNKQAKTAASLCVTVTSFEEEAS